MLSRGMLHLFQDGNLLDFYRCCHSYLLLKLMAPTRFLEVFGFIFLYLSN